MSVAVSASAVSARPRAANRAFDEYRVETLKRLEKSETDSGFPRSPASTPKDKKSSTVHGPAQAASDAAERSAAGLRRSGRFSLGRCAP